LRRWATDDNGASDQVVERNSQFLIAVTSVAGGIQAEVGTCFWIEFGARLGKTLLPLAWCYVSRRMPPEEEAEWRAAERRGQGEEWLKKRWRQSSDR